MNIEMTVINRLRAKVDKEYLCCFLYSQQYVCTYLDWKYDIGATSLGQSLQVESLKRALSFILMFSGILYAQQS